MSTLTERRPWNAITDVPGITVGQWTDLRSATGCTVVLCEDGAIAGVDVRGSPPGTRETDLMRPVNLVDKVHAVVLAGGSAFGLDAAHGVMRYLDERKQVTKGGLGSASIDLDDGTIVGAIVAVNAFGEVVDAQTAKVIAGPRKEDGTGYADSVECLRTKASKKPLPGENTTIGVVATNAKLTKEEANKVAQMAHDGLGMSIRPAHTLGDGDVIFAMATARTADGLPRRSRRGINVTAIGALAAAATAQAVVRGVREAESLAGVPAARDFLTIR